MGRLVVPENQKKLCGSATPRAEVYQRLGSHPTCAQSPLDLVKKRQLVVGGSLLGHHEATSALCRGQKVPVLSFPISAPDGQTVSEIIGFFCDLGVLQVGVSTEVPQLASCLGHDTAIVGGCVWHSLDICLGWVSQ